MPLGQGGHPAGRTGNGQGYQAELKDDAPGGCFTASEPRSSIATITVRWWRDAEGWDSSGALPPGSSVPNWGYLMDAEPSGQGLWARLQRSDKQSSQYILS